MKLLGDPVLSDEEAFGYLAKPHDDYPRCDLHEARRMIQNYYQESRSLSVGESFASAPGSC